MATKYWYKAANGSDAWSVVGNWYLGSGGTGGGTTLPTANDDVILDAASGSGTITLNTTGQVRSIVATTFTGTFTGTTNLQVVGSNTATQNSGKSIEWGTGMTYSYTGQYTITSTNGSGSINFNGKVHGSGLISLNAGTTNHTIAVWTLLNSITSSGTITLAAGTLTTNNYNITCGRFDLGANALTKVLNLGSTIITLTNTSGAIWNNSSTGGLVFNGNYTIRYNAIAVSVITFIGGGATYNIVEFIRGGSTAQLTVTGNNTFYDFIDNTSTAAHTISFPAGGTQTFQNFNVKGASGLSRITLATTVSTTTTLVKSTPGLIFCDYLNLGTSYVISVSPFNTWYAGFNSIGTGAGWVFRNPLGMLTMGVGG
jgi:hypothetical protein